VPDAYRAEVRRCRLIFKLGAGFLISPARTCFAFLIREQRRPSIHQFPFSWHSVVLNRPWSSAQRSYPRHSPQSCAHDLDAAMNLSFLRRSRTPAVKAVCSLPTRSIARPNEILVRKRIMAS
jgi:hypothetical protein